MLTPQEVKELSRISAGKTVLFMTGDALLVIAAFAAVILHPTPWVYLLALILIGRTQLALAILMHDGSHRRLFASQKMNDWIGQFALAAPLLFAMDSYKKLHLKHHLNPLAADDPDLSLIGGYPISRASFARKILRDLSGVSYLKFIRYFIYLQRNGARSNQPKAAGNPAKTSALTPRGVPKKWVAVSILLAQGAIFGVLDALGHPWLYLTLWLVPAMTILQVLLRIRGIAEHAGYQPGPDQSRNARTVINPLQTFFFAPHGVHYHIEHHLYPSVPFYRLPKLHRLLSERGSLPPENVYAGYGAVLSELVR